MEKFKSVIGREFIEKTKYQYSVPSDQEKELPQPPLDQEVEAGKPVIDLPASGELNMPTIDLLTAIENRKSTRKFGDGWLTLKELTYLLWTTQGVKRVTSRPATLRTVPSAGSRHPLETYLWVHRVEGLVPGIYRYKAIGHKLVQLDTSEGWDEKLTAACYKQPFVGNAAVSFFWAVDIYRTEWRYNERAYRYVLLDAGHVCQNLHLACEAIGAGMCAVGAFFDDALNALLGLDGQAHFVVYAAAVGR
jgi:SagB-type dehydrogenase family enzyme